MDVTPQDVLNARQAAGLTQPQAAAAVHLARWQTWQDWERGVSPPDIARYRLFCHLAGLERLPFGTIQASGSASDRETAELAGKIDEMLAGKPRRLERQR